MADPIMKEGMHDSERFESKTTYREGAIAGEGGETKRGLKSRHIQFLYVA
jgi:amino acid permease